MKRLQMIQMMVLLAAVAGLAFGQAEKMLEAARQKEVMDGDLKAAIEQYRKIAAQFAKQPAVAAQALLKMGQCQEKLGQAEARRSYERVVKEYGGAGEFAAQARARLAQLTSTTTESGALSSRLLFSQPGVRGLRRVSEDGRILAFINATGGLVVRDLQTGISQERVRHGGASNGSSMVWAPVPNWDGSAIAYAIGGGAAEPRYELRIIPSAGGESRAVPLDRGESGMFTPWDWAPNGRHLAGWLWSPTKNVLNFAVIDTQTGERRGPDSRRAHACGGGVFSPDGKQIAAACFFDENPNKPPNRDIVLFDIATGTEWTILGGGHDDRSPIWSSATGKILFISNRQGKDGLWMVDPKTDGTAAPVLLQGNLGATGLLGLAKDGTLHFSRDSQSRDVYMAALDPSSLRVEGQPTRFVDTYMGNNSSPAWSPSGDAFAYVSFRDISGESRVIVRKKDGTEAALADGNFWSYQTPRWCSESRLLVWGNPHPATRRLYDASTGAIAGTDIKIEGLRAAYQLGYSPDCQTVYVSARPQGSERREIFRVDLATKRRTELYSDDAEWALAPTVSPDGKWLAMVGRLASGGPVGLLLMPATGGTPKMLATGADDDGLSWTPDSKRVFFRKNDEIFAVSIEGGAPTATGIRGRGLIGPSLHPDGKRALFSSRETSAEVWSLRNFLPK